MTDLGIDGITDASVARRGGFAIVYRARQPAFDREVAVKVIQAKPDEHNLNRFRREVRAMGQLSEHPSIATVLDAGTTPDGRPYLLMPFLSGGSLGDALARGSRFSGRQAAEIGVKLASALHAAHSQGILHRDVKPANVMIGRYGDPLLVDFGIARIAGGTETASGVFSATLHHAAPELLDGEPPSVATDVYALGSTLYTLIVGLPAFASLSDETVLPAIRRIMTDPVPGLQAHGVTPELEAVIHKAMAKNPAERHADAAAMAEDLQGVLEGGEAPTVPEDCAAVSAPPDDTLGDTPLDDELTAEVPGTQVAEEPRSAVCDVRYRGDLRGHREIRPGVRAPRVWNGRQVGPLDDVPAESSWSRPSDSSSC